MLKWNPGRVMEKKEPMENSEKRKFASPVFQWHSISINTQKRKPETQTLGRASKLKFFLTININEMAAIFQVFHHGPHWYSVSTNTRKTRDPNFEGVGNLKFFHMIDINEMAAIFQFFHNGWCWYSVNTGKTGDMNLVQFSEFSVGSVFPATLSSFCFNINVWPCLEHFCVVTFLHSENWGHKFSVDSVFQTFPLVQFSLTPILGSISTFMCGCA